MNKQKIILLITLSLSLSLLSNFCGETLFKIVMGRGFGQEDGTSRTFRTNIHPFNSLRFSNFSMESNTVMFRVLYYENNEWSDWQRLPRINVGQTKTLYIGKYILDVETRAMQMGD